MGIFDFLKEKEPDINDCNNIPSKDTLNILEEKTAKKINSSQSLVPYFGNLVIPEYIRQLLWFGDGKFQNYNIDDDQKVLFENELFQIIFVFKQEPSLIYTGQPVDFGTNCENVEKLGYYPSYERLNPQQRYVYLNWLGNIAKPVDIGYVFIFYYGLERHLISGKYTDSVDTILRLRQHHKHPSFLSYSASALILSSILHKDKETLIKVLDIIDDTNFCNSLVLLGKFLMHIDLTIEEIISLSSAVGFTNKRYIKDYPEIFREKIESILIKEFGKNSYPLYQLKMQFPSHHILAFANISLEQEIRSPLLPDLIHSPEFSSSLKAILTTAHNEVKLSLTEMRKTGTAPAPKSGESDGTVPKPECPHCHNILNKMLQAKKKCPFCKNEIIVRTDPVEKKKILLRDDQIEEFEEKLQKIRCHKAIQRLLDNHNIDSMQFDQVKENLKMKMGSEPSEKDVALEIVDNLGYHYFKNLDMGLFRNTILEKGDIFKVSGDLKNALIMYLELCYIDLNGPSNRSSINFPELLEKYPAFNPKNSSEVFLAPGIISYIKQISKEMNLSIDDIKQIFFEHNQIVEKSKKLPLPVQDAWLNLESELIL
jgi:hypothetical protein